MELHKEQQASFRILLLVILLLIVSTPLAAQNLEQLNHDRIQRTKTGMMILGAWAVGNIAISPILKRNASGSTAYFYDMNVYWNAVNLAIAGFSYYSLTKENPGAYSLAESMAEQQSIEKILLFNTGLDVGYVLGGLYLNERGKNNSDDRLKGFGKSIILQGGFLFVFDLAFYLFQKKGSSQLLDLMENIQLGASSIGYIHRF